MSFMPESYVTGAQIDGKNRIVLSVDVDAFIPGESVEISGYAIQEGDGGFATFSEVQTINTHKPGDVAKLTVKATPAQGKGFVQGQDVTVFLQVSKVWMTVLSEQDPSTVGTTGHVTGASGPAGKGWKWGYVKGVGGPDKDSSSASKANQAAYGPASTGQPPVGGPSAPQAGVAAP
jgi:hypothetical protein